jgi:hypothetical protein
LITFDPWFRPYVRLAGDSGVEPRLLTWLPGQGTEWQDHGGSAGTFLTVRGTLTERQAMGASRRPTADPAGDPDRGNRGRGYAAWRQSEVPLRVGPSHLAGTPDEPVDHQLV